MYQIARKNAGDMVKKTIDCLLKFIFIFDILLYVYIKIFNDLFYHLKIN